MNRIHVNLINKGYFQVQNVHKRRLGLFEPMICLIVCILFFSTGTDVNADAGRGAASGAAVGGFLGLDFRSCFGRWNTISKLQWSSGCFSSARFPS